MSTFKDRLLEEKAQLDERRDKLHAFLVNVRMKNDKVDIEPVQITLLNIQEKAMETYSECLRERIEWLGKTWKPII